MNGTRLHGTPYIRGRNGIWSRDNDAVVHNPCSAAARAELPTSPNVYKRHREFVGASNSINALDSLPALMIRS